MCQILEIKPGKMLPLEMLTLACDINKHGYGIAYIEKGRIKIERSLSQPNNPKEIHDKLEKLKKRTRWVHLRHATVGSVSLLNNHPFAILEERGTRLALMHNGTLGNDYLPEKDDNDTSDTLLFANTFVKPLAERTAAYYPRNSVLADSLFVRLMKKEIGSYSVVLMFDSEGKVLKINGDRGPTFDWGWASNSYSFNPQHERSSVRTPTVYRSQEDIWANTNFGGSTSGLPWEEYKPKYERAAWEIEIEQDAQRRMAAGRLSAEFAFGQAHRELAAAMDEELVQLDYQIKEVTHLINSRVTKGKELLMSEPDPKALRVPRDTFLKMSGLPNLDAINHMSAGDLEHMCDEYPKASKELIIDLFTNWKTADLKLSIQSKTLRDLREDKDADRAEKADRAKKL